MRLLKNLVMIKPNSQQKEAVIAAARALTLEGNTSAITAHGNGPKPDVQTNTVGLPVCMLDGVECLKIFKSLAWIVD